MLPFCHGIPSPFSIIFLRAAAEIYNSHVLGCFSFKLIKLLWRGKIGHQLDGCSGRGAVMNNEGKDMMSAVLGQCRCLGGKFYPSGYQQQEQQKYC